MGAGGKLSDWCVCVCGGVWLCGGYVTWYPIMLLGYWRCNRQCRRSGRARDDGVTVADGLDLVGKKSGLPVKAGALVGAGI